MRQSKSDLASRKVACLANLRDMLAPGQSIFCMTQGVSPSGMTRWVRCYVASVPREDRRQSGYLVNTTGTSLDTFDHSYGPTNVGSVADITWWAAHAAGLTWSEAHRAITMGGCGYDTHQAAVDSLARSLGFPLRYASL